MSQRHVEKGKNCKQFQQEVPNFSGTEKENISTIYHFLFKERDREI